MLLAHLSAGMPSSPSSSRRRARAYQTIRARRISAVKDTSLYAIGLLIWAATILFLCDPAFLHCNRWAHSSCATHLTHR
jgi:hypothetical protein